MHEAGYEGLVMAIIHHAARDFKEGDFAERCAARAFFKSVAYETWCNLIDVNPNPIRDRLLKGASCAR